MFLTFNAEAEILTTYNIFWIQIKRKKISLGCRKGNRDEKRKKKRNETKKSTEEKQKYKGTNNKIKIKLASWINKHVKWFELMKELTLDRICSWIGHRK